ncbi:MAG: hypothetical protein AVDCRST_MAG40-978, partial [uncultured Gemmatimonadaceae bacterium]
PACRHRAHARHPGRARRERRDAPRLGRGLGAAGRPPPRQAHALRGERREVL